MIIPGTQDAEIIQKAYGFDIYEVMRTAPAWRFDPDALIEIGRFSSSITDTEYEAMEKVALAGQPPVIVSLMADRGNAFQCLTFPHKGNFHAITSERATKLLPLESIDKLCNVACTSVVIRFHFKSRYIEKLTKHQQRILRRTGSLPVTEPRIISIAWDAPTPRYVPGTGATAQEEHSDRKVCWHEVHGHPRHLRSGRTVWVRAHSRGSKDIERKTTYNFTRSRRSKHAEGSQAESPEANEAGA